MEHLHSGIVLLSSVRSVNKVSCIASGNGEVARHCDGCRLLGRRLPLEDGANACCWPSAAEEIAIKRPRVLKKENSLFILFKEGKGKALEDYRR